MFRFFYGSSVEKKPLLDMSLNEVIVYPDSVNPSFSNIYNATNVSLYKETKACIKILNNAKKNLFSYLIYEQKRRDFVFIYNLVCLSALPATTFTLAFKFHQQLFQVLRDKMLPLLQPFNKAIETRHLFINWYNDKIDKLDQSIRMCTHPYRHCVEGKFASEGRFFSVCGDSFPSPPLIWVPDIPYTVPDYCTQARDFNYPIEECNQLVKTLCEEEKEYITCANKLQAQLPQALEEKQQFQTQYRDEISTLNQEVDHWQVPLNALKAENTWEPISSAIFGLSAFACCSLTVYYYKSWRQAKDDYQKDLAKHHELHECLKDSKDVTRIINLTVALDISLKELPLEILICTLESRKSEMQPKEARTSFLKVAHRHGLPREISKDILVMANMQADPPRSMRP